MPALARALLLAVLTCLVVWALTIDWSGGFSRPIAATVPLPGLVVGGAAALATLLLPAGGRRPARRRGWSGPSISLVVVLAGLAVLGLVGWRMNDRFLSAVLTDHREAGPVPTEATRRPVPTTAKGPADPPMEKAAPARPTPPPEAPRAAAGRAGAATLATATPSPSPARPTPDAKRYEITSFAYDVYPEAGAAGVSLTFRDRQQNRPALAYYDLVRDAGTITVTVSAGISQTVASRPETGPIRAIEQSTDGDRARFVFRLAQSGVGIVDETLGGQTGVRLMFIPGTGSGALTRAPSPVP